MVTETVIEVKSFIQDMNNHEVLVIRSNSMRVYHWKEELEENSRRKKFSELEEQETMPERLD
jgi:hypothetical protein